MVIIPTYNERNNVEKMVETLADIFPQIKDHDLHALFVDDTSPDQTYEVVAEKAKKYPWVHLLVNKEKQGLGAAYAAGMQYAMKDLGADYFMEFDCDFQHAPSDIPRLVAEIDGGYDYIIGSRYIKGGSIPKQWSLDRKLLSGVGNIVARILLILPHIHDVTGGFKLSRVKGFMDSFDFSTLLSKSFAYKVHLLFYMVQKGARVKEVPVHFQLRTAGDSKIIKNEMAETLRVIFWLQVRNPKMQRFFKFGVVGSSGLAIQTAIFEFFGVVTRVLSPSVATAIGGEVAIISNFMLNNLWTFKDFRVSGWRLIPKFLQFNLTSLLALVIQFVVLRIGESVARGSPVIIQFFYFGAIILVLITNYYIYNKFIWKTATKTGPS